MPDFAMSDAATPDAGFDLDECCVLIPASTLEDFPAKLSDADARSLLAAWTVAWHPRLIARSGQTPAWYRADAPPNHAIADVAPLPGRIVLVPTPSIEKLPDDYADRCAADPTCRWITAASRAEMLDALELQPCAELVGPDTGVIGTGVIGTGVIGPGVIDRGTARRIGVADFFAAGFAVLQIQIMTRRLRYTSNLDEILLQSQMVAAAEAFLAGDAAAAAESLHQVFDSLAEERDHYFTSDPHLIDLTLSTESTTSRLVDFWTDHRADFLAKSDNDGPVRPTPISLLVDPAAAKALKHRSATDPAAADLVAAMADRRIGWAGGGPPADVMPDTRTLVQSQNALVDARAETVAAIGAPPVYGRIAGATPSDMTATIASLGYVGMIPIDFAGGTGHGDEAKVILQAGGAEIEALTSKPIDASSDASFLAIGASLGEAIDSGEVATALLVHWPGQACDSFDDLRRVASWSVSLGRFWRLDDYFVDGEHPYHHGRPSVASDAASAILDAAVAANRVDPITSIADTFCQGIASERDAMIAAMAGLASGTPCAPTVAPENLAAAVGAKNDPAGDAVLVINPHGTGVRQPLVMGKRPARADHIFGMTRVAGGVAVSVDVPAGGFVMLKPSDSRSGSRSDSRSDGGNDRRVRSSLRTWFRNKWLGNPTSIAANGRLQNEFLDVTIQPESGGIAGVYSGAARGNRFSMRVVAIGMTAGETESKMVADQIRVSQSTLARGAIDVAGRVTDDAGVTLANVSLVYSLDRGSRVVHVDGTLSPTDAALERLGDDPWRHYFAARAAVASDASIGRVMLRDKIHRGNGRRLVAPLGLVIDESDRQTLVAGHGRAFHRKVDARFYDTLLCVRGQANPNVSLRYGFDVPTPVATAKSLVAAPVQLVVTPLGRSSPDVGWMIHASPKEVAIVSMDIQISSSGQVGAMVRIVQTRPKACKATLRFFRDVASAKLVAGKMDEAIRWQPPTETESSGVKVNGDAVTVSLASHAVIDVWVVFQA